MATVPRSLSALLTPKRMEPSICERAPSGLTTIPQSTAQTIFSTWTLPVAGSTRAWTTEAVQVGVFFSWALTQAMPRPVFGGSGVPQPAWSAASRSTRASRGALPSIESRYCSGSTPASFASSSMNVSTAKNV